MIKYNDNIIADSSCVPVPVETQPTAKTSGTVSIPDNIEELIAAYLAMQARRLMDANLPHREMVWLDVQILSFDHSPNVLNVKSSVSTVLIGTGPTATKSESLHQAVTEHIEKCRAFDPVQVRRDQITKLEAELAELEGGQA